MESGTPDAVRHRRHANSAAPLDQGCRKPIRPAVGKLFRRAVGLCEDGLVKGPAAADQVVSRSATGECLTRIAIEPRVPSDSL